MKIDLFYAYFPSGKSIILNMMRLAFLLFFTVSFGFTPFNGLSQDLKVNLNIDKTLTVDEVFDLIEKQTPYRFIYPSSLIKDLPKIEVKKGTITVKNLLNSSFTDVPVKYEFRNKKNIVLSKASENTIADTEEQQQTITGTVTDEDGVPLPGVNITVEGTTRGTQTDFDGNYSIEAETGEVLVFSFVGFKEQKVTVGDNVLIHISLEESASALDEVVVVGYGTKKKSDITGAISNVSSEDLNNGGALTSVDQLLDGRVAGVEFKRNSSQPGGGGQTLIRGRNSIFGGTDPLYVIDGIPINRVASPESGANFSNPTRNPLNLLNPNDIESIAVLKDAAATAIYGTRGSNGVILITTKSGKGKMAINYNVYMSFQSQKESFELLSSNEYMRFWNSQEAGPTFTNEEINAAATTNWLDKITRQGIIKSHQLSLSAADEDFRYYFSSGYFDHKGILKNSGLKRFNGRLNMEYNKGKFKINTNIFGTLLKGQNQASEGGSRNSIISSAITFAPYLKLSDENDYIVDPASEFNVYPLSLLNINDKTRTDKLNSNISFQYEVLPGLKPELKLGYDTQNAVREFFIPSITPSNGGSPDPRTGRFEHGGTAILTSQRATDILINGLVHYDKNIDNENELDIVAGYSFEKEGYLINRTRGIGFTNDVFGVNNMGSALTQENYSHKEVSTIISAFGRVDYTLNDRYFFTGTLRRDGVSKFGKSHKWGWFPGLSLGWKVSDEGFMKRSEAIDLLKMRLGWGITGNSDFDNYLSLNKYIVNRTDGGIIGQRVIPATTYSPVQANPDLKWESTSQLNFGMDFSLWKGKLEGSLDYFIKRTKDMIVPLPLLNESGYDVRWANAADFKTNGLEFNLNFNVMQSDNFNWSTRLNLTFMDNKVSAINVPGEAARSSLSNIGIIEGEKPNSYYTYQFKELNEEGSMTFVDLNQDGKIDLEDRKVLGSPDPGFLMGFGSELGYKNFSLDIYFNGAFGRELYNGVKAQYTTLNTAQPGNLLRAAITEENISNGTSIGGNDRFNSRWIENASYLKLQNIRASYNVPVDEILGIVDRFTVYIQAQNLFTITSYSGLDPEAGNTVATQETENLPAFLPGGIDNNTYPPARTYSLGFNITF